ncbi:hypothetical protein MNBD_PLANCTO02-245 [hydrothermal vent metagenome]|uniref:Zinc-finger domain-containing protein n=1 Tax=hydrothermal vent metagenome TaxID=652676 RepID=A0A3B1D8T7_9ZZZZ
MQSENMNQPDHQENSQPWEDCPQGEVGRLVGSLRQKKRQRRAIQGAAFVGIAMMLLAVGFTLSQFLLQSSDPLLQGKGHQYAGICCEKVQSYGKEYMADTVDTKIAHKIEGHLEECQQCQSKFEIMQQELLNTTAQFFSFDQYALLQ